MLTGDAIRCQLCGPTSRLNLSSNFSIESPVTSSIVTILKLAVCDGHGRRTASGPSPRGARAARSRTAEACGTF
jgi:hypothetical protein